MFRREDRTGRDFYTGRNERAPCDHGVGVDVTVVRNGCIVVDHRTCRDQTPRSDRGVFVYHCHGFDDRAALNRCRSAHERMGGNHCRDFKSRFQKPLCPLLADLRVSDGNDGIRVIGENPLEIFQFSDAKGVAGCERFFGVKGVVQKGDPAEATGGYGDFFDDRTVLSRTEDE